jgi:inner membrane protein
MKGNSHIAVSITLAVVAENVFHPAGAPVHWTGLVHLLAHPAGPTGEIVSKAIYYGCTIIAARLPDLDLSIPLFGKHRGFTHSLLGDLLFALILLTSGFFGLCYLQAHRISVSPQQEALGLLAIWASTLSCFYHMLADSLTVAGIRFLWPADICIHLLPKSCRIRTGRSSEYLVVTCWMVLIGALIWSNLLGF